MLKSLLPDHLPSDAIAAVRQISLDTIVEVLVILLIFLLLSRGLNRFLNALGTHSARARALVQSWRALLQLVLWIFALYLCVRILAPSQNTVLVAFGSAALAIGFGTQDLVRNWAGGLVVLLNHPYRIGDRVRIGSAYGEVIHIGLHSTRVYSIDGDVVTIPNATIWSEMIFNMNYGAPNCMTVTDIYLPIDAPVDEVMQIGREAAATSPYLYLPEPILVSLHDELSETPQMRLRIRAFVYDHRLEYELTTDIACRFKRELARRGIASVHPEPEKISV